MLRSALLVIGDVDSWRHRISWEKTPALIAGALFRFPLRAFLPPPFPSFLRLPRRLKRPKDSMRSAVR